MKKIVIRILTVIAVIAMLIIGKIQMDKYRVKGITDGEEGKAAIENMLKIMDEKALTPEGKIKSYKIDDSYTYKNPMGGVGIKLIINNDNDLTVKTVLNKYPSIGVLEHGGIIKSRKMSELTPAKGKLYDEENNIKNR